MEQIKKQRVLNSGTAFGEEDDEETRFQIVKILLEEFPELKEHVRKYVESTR